MDELYRSFSSNRSIYNQLYWIKQIIILTIKIKKIMLLQLILIPLKNFFFSILILFKMEKNLKKYLKFQIKFP